MCGVTPPPPPPQQPDPYGPQPGQQPQPQQGYPPPQYAPQPPPRKKGGAGKIVLIILAVLVVLCGGGIAVIAVVANSAKNATTPAAHVGMNQPARDGKFEFTVTKIQCGVAKVGDDVLGKTAQGQFCLVTVTVKNIGSQPQIFNGGDQKAHAPDGTTYGNSGDAELYANKDTQTFLEQINPGNSVTGMLVFDIPKTATIKTLELHDSPFSGGVIVTVA
jgi:hypothetical protein